MFTLLLNLDKNVIAQQKQQKHPHITFISLSYQLQLPYFDFFPLLSQKLHQLALNCTDSFKETYTNKLPQKILQGIIYGAR